LPVTDVAAVATIDLASPRRSDSARGRQLHDCRLSCGRPASLARVSTGSNRECDQTELIIVGINSRNLGRIAEHQVSDTSVGKSGVVKGPPSCTAPAAFPRNPLGWIEQPRGQRAAYFSLMRAHRKFHGENAPPHGPISADAARCGASFLGGMTRRIAANPLSIPFQDVAAAPGSPAGPAPVACPCSRSIAVPCPRRAG